MDVPWGWSASPSFEDSAFFALCQDVFVLNMLVENVFKTDHGFAFYRIPICRKCTLSSDCKQFSHLTSSMVARLRWKWCFVVVVFVHFGSPSFRMLGYLSLILLQYCFLRFVAFFIFWEHWKLVYLTIENQGRKNKLFPKFIFLDFFFRKDPLWDTPKLINCENDEL